jgi:hypothetical protein
VKVFRIIPEVRIFSLLKAFYFLCKTVEKLLNSGFSGFLKFPTFTHGL